MEQITQDDLVNSFINCSKGQRNKIFVPPVEELLKDQSEKTIFIGWKDLQKPQEGYVVTEVEGDLVGILMKNSSNKTKSLASASMCQMCKTVLGKSEVSLYSAAKAGDAGRRGSTVGTYMCRDLTCLDYVNGTKKPILTQPGETLTVSQRKDRLHNGISKFISKVRETE